MVVLLFIGRPRMRHRTDEFAKALTKYSPDSFGESQRECGGGIP